MQIHLDASVDRPGMRKYVGACRAGRHNVAGTHADDEARRGHLLPGRRSHHAQHAGLRAVVPRGVGAL